jgi:hypothetical protein
LPRNLLSKRPYRGINLFLLSTSKYVSPFWLTIRQANELGGYARKGEESAIVVFWKIDNEASALPPLVERSPPVMAVPSPPVVQARNFIRFVAS